MQDNPFAALASRLITESEFAAAYAAADFSREFGMTLDTHVTLSWPLLGCNTPDEIQKAFLSFTKCLRDWLTQRALPVAFLYAHETSKALGAHTHVLVYVPGAPSPYRSEFLRWMGGYAERQLRRRAPRSIRVRGPKRESVFVHWLLFSYLMKGYDRGAVVQSARNAPDGVAVYLGDLIAVPWRDPGPVELRKRVYWSQSLSADRREIGVPAGFDYLLPRVAVSPTFSIVGSNEPDRLDWRRADRVIRGPFRSKYDDGVRDVRVLYPREFWEPIIGSELTVTATDDEVWDEAIAQLEAEGDWLAPLQNAVRCRSNTRTIEN